MSVWTVVVAAGRGERFRGDKQTVDLGGQPVVVRSTAGAASVSDGVVVVVAEDRRQEITELLGGIDGVEAVVAGGESRSASVRAGLIVVPEEVEIILIHDGARPLASKALFTRVVEAVRAGAEAVVPGVELTDSLRTADGLVVDRHGAIAVQTPQGFRAGPLRTAHSSESDASDDATLVEATGSKVVVVEGESTNLKITRPFDLDVAAALLDNDETRMGGHSG